MTHPWRLFFSIARRGCPLSRCSFRRPTGRPNVATLSLPLRSQINLLVTRYRFAQRLCRQAKRSAAVDSAIYASTDKLCGIVQSRKIEHVVHPRSQFRITLSANRLLLDIGRTETPSENVMVESHIKIQDVQW